MAQYDIYVFCHNCSDSHQMGMRIRLDGGPTHKDSIGNLYAGSTVPPNLASLLRNAVQCPNTGQMFVGEDHNHVFLVPGGDENGIPT